MVDCGTDQLREQEVGPVAHRYLNGFGHAGSGIQDDEAVRRRGEHPSQGDGRIGELAGQAACAAGIGDRPRQAELEAGRCCNRTGRTKIEPLAGDGQQREVIVDDDHSGRLEVRVGTAESAGPVGDVAGGADQGGIERGVLGEIELPVNKRSDDITAG